MRVLHVLPTRDPTYGGPVAVVDEYAKEFPRQGVQLDIFPDEKARVWQSLLYFPGISPLKYLTDRISSYDLIHIHGLWHAASAVSAWIARAEGIPYVVTLHGMLDRWALRQGRIKKNIYFRLVEKRNLRSAASVHMLNAGEYEASKTALGSVRTLILPNGVDVSAYYDLPDKAALNSLFPQIAGKIVLLFLGRINYKKGLDLLIAAFVRARRANKDLHLLIAGPDDGYLKRVVELVKQNAIGDHVTLTGMVSGTLKQQILAAAHMFVLTSYQEGDSMALKEAMAAGLPGIMSSACNFPEAEEHDCGVIVPHDAAAVAEAVLRLANDRQRLHAMGERAKSLMQTRYTWAAITAELITHYRTLLRFQEK